MVAVIHGSKSLKSILHYNEQKVSLRKAECIHSHLFAKDTEVLLLKDKIRTLEKLTSLNHRTKINAVHISLNFDSDDELNSQKLKRIADSYMDQIGFGEQPFLVYQHHDAGHPHLHIVTTNIRRDGSRISLHNIGRIQSEKGRQMIEQEFGLLRTQQQREAEGLRQVKPLKVEYGRSETKAAIQSVLDAVVPHYKYASLAELNAVLKLYNVLADRGSEKSKMYKHGGLVYRILNQDGKKVGAPLKASLFHDKPTLSFLEARFIQNREEKQRHQQRVKNAVDLLIIRNTNPTLPSLWQSLEKEQISLVTGQNKAALIHELTYVDHKTKCVFSGSDLGASYSASGIQQRCNPTRLVESLLDELAQKQKRKKQQHI